MSDRTTVLTVHALADELRRDILAASDTTPGMALLRGAFARHGHRAAGVNLPLEDAMAAGIDVFQEMIDRLPLGRAANSVPLAAGIAFAALAEGYQAEASTCADRDETLGKAPMSWLEALHRISRSSTATLDLQARLETSVRVVAETTGADACAIALYDEGTGVLAPRAVVGLNASTVGGVSGRPGVGITGTAAASRKVVVAPDAREHPDFVPMPGTGEDLYTSQVSIPLLLGSNDDDQRLIGVMNILSVERRDYSPDEIAFLETMAGELAISIENARLYSQTDAQLQRKIVELGTLQRVSHTITSTLDLADVLRSIAEQAVQLIDVESAAIFRLPNRRAGGVETPGIEYRVGRHRHPLDERSRNEAITDIAQSGEARALDLDYTDGSARLFCLPLRSARETLGALCLRMSTGAELTEDQMNLLQAFSDAASLAIENAMLYQDAVQGYVTTSTLLQEMHHRVRNNLQTVAALLSLQIRKNEEAPWVGALREAASRVQAIAGIHDLLSDETRLAGTTVDVIARHVATEAHRTLIPPGLEVTFDIPASDVMLPSRQATILALLINELVANAVRHGFAGLDRGHVRIATRMDGANVVVEVENDGNAPRQELAPEKSTGLGMKIIQRLVTSDLGGRFEIGPVEHGTLATLTFPMGTEVPGD